MVPITVTFSNSYSNQHYLLQDGQGNNVSSDEPYGSSGGTTTATYNVRTDYLDNYSEEIQVSPLSNYDPSGTLSITFPQCGNHAPVANNDSASTPENMAVATNVTANDTDADGDYLTVTSASTPTHGTTSITGGTSVIYTPASGYTGSDTYTYTISDGNQGTATATVYVTVTVPAPPGDSSVTLSATSESLSGTGTNGCQYSNYEINVLAQGVTASHLYGFGSLRSGTYYEQSGPYKIDSSGSQGGTTDVTPTSESSTAQIAVANDDNEDPRSGNGAVILKTITVEVPACNTTTNTPPVARLSVNPISGVTPLTVTADASASTDDRGVVSYKFDWNNDGSAVTVQTTPVAQYTYTAVGHYTIALTVTDANGDESTLFQGLDVTAPPAPPAPTPTPTPSPSAPAIPTVTAVPSLPKVPTVSPKTTITTARATLGKLKVKVGNIVLGGKLAPKSAPKHELFVVTGYELQTTKKIKIKLHGKTVTETVVVYKPLRKGSSIPKGSVLAVEVKLVKS